MPSSPSSPPHPSRTRPSPHPPPAPPPPREIHEQDRAVKSTADDAILAKLSCVEMGYYEDPFVRSMARGASGLVSRTASSDISGGGRRQPSNRQRCHGNEARCSSTGTEPIIRRGTHARVKAVDRAIDSFLSLPLPASSRERQVVVLGAGRDTTYLRYRFGKGGKTLANSDNVRWYEVDHPSMMRQKAQSWLRGCVPDGSEYECDANEDTGNSYGIAITPSKGESNNNNNNNNNERSTMPKNYHLIGHDLRSSPASLFETLAHPKHGYDRSVPTLFVLECVLMYLPEEASWDLLRHIAESPSSPKDARPLPHHQSSPNDPFVAVVVYDPIPSDTRFGQLMIKNLRRAGIAGGDGRGSIADDARSPQLGLEGTRSLRDQLARLARSGFDVAVGCDMADAYDRGVVTAEDRGHAARCEMLDELEEFVLLMRHYCLVVGVSSSGNGDDGANASEGGSVGFRLCSVGRDSLMGFQEGHCEVVNRLK